LSDILKLSLLSDVQKHSLLSDVFESVTLSCASKTVTDLHILCTALHPSYPHHVDEEAIYDRAISKLRDVAHKLHSSVIETLQDFGDLHCKVRYTGCTFDKKQQRIYKETIFI